MATVSPSYAYGFDASAMHSSQAPTETPRVQRNLVKDIVAQFNEEAKHRESKLHRHHSYEPSDNGYSPSPPPVIPLGNTSSHSPSRHVYPLPLSKRSRSEHSLVGSQDGGGGVVYAQVHVVNGSNKGDAATNGKYKTTVHTVVPQPLSSSVFGRYNKLAKSTGSLHRVQQEEEEDEEDNRVLSSLNNKSTSDNHSYYRFDDPANDSYKNVYNSATRNGHTSTLQQKSKRRSNSEDDDDVFHNVTSSRNGGHIIPLRLSNGANESPPGAFQTKNVEKWSEKEDLGPHRRKFIEHEKVHLVTVSGDSYGGGVGRIKSSSPNLKTIKNDVYAAEEEERARLRRHREATASPSGSNYSKKITNIEDSTLQRSRTVTPDVVITPKGRSRSPKAEVNQYYFGQPSKSTTSRHHVTENVTLNEENRWQESSRGRCHSTDSGSGGVLLSSRLVKQADREFNSPPLPPLMTSSWRREEENELHNGRLRSFSPRLRSLSPRQRPLSPSSGISSVNSGRVVGETKEEKRHFRKQETTKTTKHETERSRVKPTSHRSRSAERHHRQLEITNDENEPVAPIRSASSNTRHRRHKVNGTTYYHDDERMETSGSEQQLYGGSQGSHMSVGSANHEEHHRALSEKENIMAAHSNTPNSMLKQMNKNTYSYENAQRQEGSTTSANSLGGRRMWFERLNDDADDVKLSSATMSRLENKKNRRNHYSDNELSVNTVDRRDVMRRRRNHHHADRSHAHQVARSSSFNSRVDNYHSEVENESQASSTASKPKKVNFKSNGFLSPMHREALLRSASPVRAPSVVSNDSEASNRSVILHATAVADIPAPAQYRQRSANTSPAPSISGSADGRSSSLSRGGRQKESRTVQRSFSLLSPWKPKKYKEKYSATSSAASSRRGSHQKQEEVHKQTQQKSQENLSHNSSSAERLDSLSPLPSEATPTKSKKKAGLLHRRHSMPKDSRFANFFRRKNKESKKK